MNIPNIDIEPTGQHDYILLDRSGSMAGSKWDEALGGINSYVKKLAEDGVDTQVTLAAFDTNNGGFVYDVLRSSVPPAVWAPVTNADAMPRGSTPLSDAVRQLVGAANAGNFAKVAIIIVTDGMENASQKTTVDQAKQMLDACRERGWQVIFLGADFAAVEQQAQQYGNAQWATAMVRPEKMARAFAATAEMRTSYSTTGEAMEYSDAAKQDFAE